MPVAWASGRGYAPWLRKLIFAGLFCLANCSRHIVSLHNVKDKPREFDFFLLVRQWPGSYCSSNDCPRLRDFGFHFTIHGLWPNYSNGSWPQFCTPEDKFDEDQLEDLMDDLEVEWPSTFFSSENAEFWEHEWSKHGTCALDIFPSEHSYFGHILKLHWRYDLSAALRKANILPSTSTAYRAQDLIDVIDDTYGVRPLVHCDDEGQLSEIWMCLDKDLKPFDCDTSQEGNACQEVVIPPLSGGGSIAPQRAGRGATAAATTAVATAAAATTAVATAAAATTAVATAAAAATTAVATATTAAATAATTGAGGSVAFSGESEVGGAAVAMMMMAGVAEGVEVEGGSEGGRTAPAWGTAEESNYPRVSEHDARVGSVGDVSSGESPAATATTAAMLALGGEAAMALFPLDGDDDVDMGSEVGTASNAAAVKVGEGVDAPNSGVNLNYLYGDAFPVVQPQNPTHLPDKEDEEEEKQQLLGIQAIEQRLLEREERMARVTAAAESRRVDGGGGAAAASAAAALKAMAERAIARLQQQVHSFGSSEHVNADSSLDESYDTTMPIPNGGAAAVASGGAQDFVWSSKLRQMSSGEVVEGFNVGEAGSAAARADGRGGGGRGTAAVAVVAEDDGKGPALWAVHPGFLVVPVSADEGGDGEDTVAAAAAAAVAAGVNVGVTHLTGAPPMWVVLLLAVQLTCLVVMTLGLVVVVGMTLAGYKLGAQDSRTAAAVHLDWDEDTEGGVADLGCCSGPQLQQQSVAVAGGRSLWLWAPSRSHEENNLAEPLLSYDKYDCDGSIAAAPAKVEQPDRECSRARSDSWPGTVLVLPVAAATIVQPCKFDASQLSPYAPVH